MAVQDTKYFFQCKLCGAKYVKRPKQCKDCGSTAIRDVKATSGRFDVVPPDAVRHFKKKLEYCWNEQTTQDGEPIKHRYVEKVVQVVDLATQEIYDETRCEECNRYYTRFNGRAASPEELEQAQSGKIETIKRQD